MKNKANDKEFLKLIQENKRIIFKICNSYCRNKDDREDLAQEIIFQLWKSWSGFNPDYKFSTWMYRIALNVAISFYRKEKKSGITILIGEHIFEMSDDNHSINETENNLKLLQQFISELNELDKALMILYLEEKNYKEISEILGITETNISTKINRIKEKLKHKFSSINN